MQKNYPSVSRTAAVLLASFIIILNSFALLQAADSRSESIRNGEKIYTEGVLPSGSPVQAFVRDDVKIEGTSFSCISCHLKSGIGSIEGQILTPPTNWAKLSKPYYQYPPIIPDVSKPPPKNMMDRPGAKPIYRPSYSEDALSAAIRFGVDPAGRELNPVMPRYLLSEEETASLISYLKTLSVEHSPGVSSAEIRFATVVAGDVAETDKNEMIALLDAVIKDHNTKAKKRNKYLNLGGNRIEPAKFNYPMFTLDVWRVTGAPSTWREQLEAYYQKKPVFALLGGIASGYYEPVHRFSEDHKIPSLLPITDLPVISGTDWYTVYFSKGVWQEGEAAARFLDRNAELADSTRILEIVEDNPLSKNTSLGFHSAFEELRRKKPYTISADSVDEAVKKIESQRPEILLLWTSEQTAGLLKKISASSYIPSRIHIAATLVKNPAETVPETLRSITFISYPYRLIEKDGKFHQNARAWLKKNGLPQKDLGISGKLFSLTKLLLEPFQVVKRDFNPAGLGKGLVIMEEQFEMMMHVRRNYYRDYLLDVIGMMADAYSLSYERISFGPGQRYISKGCYVALISDGKNPELIPQSDWVIH